MNNKQASEEALKKLIEEISNIKDGQFYFVALPEKGKPKVVALCSPSSLFLVAQLTTFNAQAALAEQLEGNMKQVDSEKNPTEESIR